MSSRQVVPDSGRRQPRHPRLALEAVLVGLLDREGGVQALEAAGSALLVPVGVASEAPLARAEVALEVPLALVEVALEVPQSLVEVAMEEVTIAESVLVPRRRGRPIPLGHRCKLLNPTIA